MGQYRDRQAEYTWGQDLTSSRITTSYNSFFHVPISISTSVFFLLDDLHYCAVSAVANHGEREAGVLLQKLGITWFF